MKYRLVKITKASGFTMWVIQKQFLWLFWEFADSYIEQSKAVDVYNKLIRGEPLEKRELIIGENEVIKK